jgi:hypothetical protein
VKSLLSEEMSDLCFAKIKGIEYNAGVERIIIK